MDHPPPFSDGGQAESYTSGLLPGFGEQSSSMSDFTSEMDPFLALPSTAQEPQQPLSEAGSLRQAPVHPPNPPPHEPQQQKHQQQAQDPSTSKHQGSSNTSAPMTTRTQGQDQLQRHHQGNQRQQLLYTPPPPGDEFDRFAYGESPTCGSGTSNNSNFSPASPAGTWPSPATSFQQPGDLFVPEPWGEVRVSTPMSVEGCSGGAADFSPASGYPEPLDLHSEWYCEPMRSQTPVASMSVLAASSCPASPAGLPTSAYMMRANDSPASSYGADMLSSRASEPPMEPSTAVTSTKQEVPYAQLIYKALKNSKDHSMSLQDLYTWFQENTDKCKPGQRGWMNSIRHNLSMNAGFTKCDRKRTKDSMTPETEDSQSNSDPKKSTEWTLTDDAIENGIQSTTRYRNKKGDKDRERQYYAQDSHGFRHGIAANRLASPRNREFPSRVAKPYQRPYFMRAPTSGYFNRTSSPHGQWYSQALYEQATGQDQNIKTEPGLSTLQGTTGPDSYGLMMPDHQMMHTGVPYDMPTNSSQSMYPIGGHSQPSAPFPFGTSDVQLGYPGAGDGADANRFATPVPADMPHGLYWPDPNEQGY